LFGIVTNRTPRGKKTHQGYGDKDGKIRSLVNSNVLTISGQLIEFSRKREEKGRQKRKREERKHNKIPSHQKTGFVTSKPNISDTPPPKGLAS